MNCEIEPLIAEINGKLFEFDLSDSGVNRKPITTVENGYLILYLGTGTVHSGGIMQHPDLAMHFWAKIPIKRLLNGFVTKVSKNGNFFYNTHRPLNV
jgi:hypothetical protein